MNHLPVELLRNVCSHLHPQDVASYRLLGRVHSEVGLDYLAPALYVTGSRKSVDRLEAIAKHEYLRTRVEAVFVEPTIPEMKFEDEVKLRGIKETSLSTAFGGLEHVEPVPERAWPKPMKRSAQQDFFKKIFASFPRVRSVGFGCCLNVAHMDNRQGWPQHCKWHKNKKDVSHLARGSLTEVKPTWNYVLIANISMSMQQLTRLLIGVGALPSGLKTLSLGGISENFFRHIEPDLLSQIEASLHSVRTLSISLCASSSPMVQRSSYRRPRPPWEPALSRLIAAAPGLEVLRLRTDDLGGSDRHKIAPYLSRLLQPGMYWPNLRILSLEYFTVDPTEACRLFGFLQDHAPSLLQLDIGNIHVGSDMKTLGLCKFLIKAIDLLQLKSLRIFGQAGSFHWQKLVHFDEGADPLHDGDTALSAAIQDGLKAYHNGQPFPDIPGLLNLQRTLVKTAILDELGRQSTKFAES